MKKSMLFVLAVAAALLLTGCRNCNQANIKIVELCSAGNELPNPNINPSHCKPEGAEARERHICTSSAKAMKKVPIKEKIT